MQRVSGSTKLCFFAKFFVDPLSFSDKQIPKKQYFLFKGTWFLIIFPSLN